MKQSHFNRDRSQNQNLKDNSQFLPPFSSHFLDDNNHTLATLKLCHTGGKCAGIIRPEGWSGERNSRNYIAADIRPVLPAFLDFFHSLSIL